MDRCGYQVKQVEPLIMGLQFAIDFQLVFDKLVLDWEVEQAPGHEVSDEQGKVFLKMRGLHNSFEGRYKYVNYIGHSYFVRNNN